MEGLVDRRSNDVTPHFGLNAKPASGILGDTHNVRPGPGPGIPTTGSER